MNKTFSSLAGVCYASDYQKTQLFSQMGSTHRDPWFLWTCLLSETERAFRRLQIYLRFVVRESGSEMSANGKDRSIDITGEIYTKRGIFMLSCLVKNAKNAS
jgi:hypothetical protein